MNPTLEKMFAGLQSGAVHMHTELGTRDEHIQSNRQGDRLQKQKTVTGIDDQILVFKDLVVPFNPMTCESDDNYNAKRPFRPILLVSQAIELIKHACAVNADLAGSWKERLGGEFDTSTEAATLADYRLFKAAGMIKPRIMTYHTVSVQLPKDFGGGDYRRKYTVPSDQLNERGSYDMENAPDWHLGAMAFNSLLRPEWEQRRRALEASGASKEQISSERRTVYAKSPIGFVTPTNLIPYVSVPLDEMPPVIKENEFMSIEKYIRFYSYTDKFTGALNKAVKNDTFDEDIDFYDLTLHTPASDERMASGKVYTDEDTAEIYQAMTITNTDGRQALHGGYSVNADGKQVPNEEAFASLLAACRQYFLYSQAESAKEDGDTFERVMAMSNRFRPIITIQDKLVPALGSVFKTTFEGSNFDTEQFRAANSTFLCRIDPKYAMSLAAMDDDEINAAAEEQKASLNSIIGEAQAGIDGFSEGDAAVEIQFA